MTSGKSAEEVASLVVGILICAALFALAVAIVAVMLVPAVPQP